MNRASVVALIVVASLLVGAGRFAVPGHGLSLAGTYEAFAHIWVGFLIGVVALRWKEREGVAAGTALVLLAALETAAFLMRAK